MTVNSLGMVILVGRTADTLLDNSRGNNEVGFALQPVNSPVVDRRLIDLGNDQPTNSARVVVSSTIDDRSLATFSWDLLTLTGLK